MTEPHIARLFLVAEPIHVPSPEWSLIRACSTVEELIEVIEGSRGVE